MVLIRDGCALAGHKWLPGDSKRSQNENLVTPAPPRGQTGVCTWCSLSWLQTRGDSNDVGGGVSDFSLWKKNTLQAHKTNLELQISERLCLWNGDKCVECSVNTQLSEMSLGWRKSSATVRGKWCCANYLLCQRVSKGGERSWTRHYLKDGKEKTNPNHIPLVCKVSQKNVALSLLYLSLPSPDFP